MYRSIKFDDFKPNISCFCNRTILITILIILLFVIISMIFYISYLSKKIEDKPKVIIKEKVNEVPSKFRKNLDASRPVLQTGRVQTVGPVDPVREYDYQKMEDPLEQPRRRVARHEIPPMHVKGYFDYPTRGYPDNFNQFGILVRQNRLNVDHENKVLRLYGRQTYPFSRVYEYYTAINSGLDSIKIPLNHKRRRNRRELFDDDIIFIKELNAKYKVQLHRYDSPLYYPHILI